ncbi:RNA-guided endonuclease InsQ/TnpB family protein [Limnoraphis robusta]|uniref:Transposase n=1 Tax=Limnoraphis robusta CS-951 TaxID=1637645 RepID=A0A0J9EXA1_9CYAN|nr:RNA-guided endonuclease TnpB family protein [Limnoraphis robusta]KMW70597.1 transposase [Limnoraphis robusta CS-951]
MLTVTYEYKFYPSQEQIATIEDMLAVCRKVWNYALRERKDWINSRKCAINSCSLQQEYIISADAPYPNYNVQAANQTSLKKTNPELKKVNAQVLQQVLKTLERAFNNMKEQGYGFPRFKNKYRMRSFVFPQLKTNPVSNDWIKLPQIGLVRMRLSRPMTEGFKLKQVRVVRRASGYFAMLSLQSPVNIPDTAASGHPLGIDVGLDKFLATSDGELIERPKFFNQLHSKLKLLQRRLKLKTSSSTNRHKLNQKIARLHQKISDSRKDFHFKLAHHLCDQAGMIFVEDLDFRTWAKGMLGKHTLDAGFGQFFNILAWVCWKRGVDFGKVDYRYTSQICPHCGAHTGKKDLAERIHKCRSCQYEINRDVAAAKVICNRGVTAVGQIVEEIDCVGVLSGVGNSLDKCRKSSKPK